MPESMGKAIFIGAVPGFDEFGKSGVCPKCGSDESLLVYECFLPEQVSEADLYAIRRYKREQARAWWQSEQRLQAKCDYCSATITRDQGYLIDTRLYCEQCTNRVFAGGLDKLRNDPHYFGVALLRKARRFRVL